MIIRRTSMVAPRHDTQAVTWLALGLLFLAVPAFAAAPVTFEAAFAKLRRDRPEAAATDLEVLARRGDARAQYFLGVAHLEGQGVPRDLARSYGWLLIASDFYEGQYARSAHDYAKNALRQLEPQLAGRDLIHGEQFAAAFRHDQEQALSAAKQRASQAILAVIDGATPAEQSANCKGPGLPASETMRASLPKGPGLYVDYPVEARRKALEGSVPVMVQLGRDGRVCQVMLTRSSGVPILDEAALKSVKRWEFNPVTLDSVPVSLVDNVWVNFQLSDYTME